MKSNNRNAISETAIISAFGTYTTAQLGYAAWQVLLRDGIEQVYKQFDCHPIEMLEDLPDESMQTMIINHANDINKILNQQREKMYESMIVEVANKASVEEVMDYLMLEVENARQQHHKSPEKIEVDFEQKVIALFKNKLDQGEITPLQIPKLLARYGLMYSLEFIKDVRSQIAALEQKQKYLPSKHFYNMAMELSKDAGFDLQKRDGMWYWKHDINKHDYGVKKELNDCLDTILESLIKESDWETEIEKNRFEGTFEEFTLTKVFELHSELCQRNSGFGVYSGQILKIDNDVVIQKIGQFADDIAYLNLRSLNSEVKEGDVVDVKFRNGVGIVNGKPKQIER